MCSSDLWVQPRYTAAAPGGTAMNNIKWVSPQEHDSQFAAVNVVNASKNQYAFGENSGSLLTGVGVTVDPILPTGVLITDKILCAITGGHTTMIIKECAPNFGYIGHQIRGSMGDGTATSTTITSYTFLTSPLQVCGAESTPTIQPVSYTSSASGNFCSTSSVVVGASPDGGTLTYVSGPGTLVGNTLQFTGVGNVVLKYTLAGACNGSSSLNKTFISESCAIDLAVNKIVDNSTPIIGSDVIFTITATNNGTYTATGVNVNDSLPAGYTYVSSVPQAGTTFNNLTGFWDIGNLVIGATVTLTVTAKVNSTPNYANTATISGNEVDPTTGNNSSTVTPVPTAQSNECYKIC